MSRKLVLAMTLTIVLVGMLGMAFEVQRVEAGGTIYIWADGSVQPDTAPISSDDNITYTFTDNINEPIVVYRDNIVVDGAGYTLQGTGSGTGIDLSDRSNVTIKNMEVKAFYYGIWLNMSSNNTISGNNITNNGHGVHLWPSSNYNSISGNNITANNHFGVVLGPGCRYNTVSGNNIAANSGDGVYLYSSSVSFNYNNIYGNNIKNNNIGIHPMFSSNNRIYHNNFVDNTLQVGSYYSQNVWDDGYPSGGNYWSNYTGQDANGDGIGDTPHFIYASNQDNCPLMGMFHSFNTSVGLYVNVISNSTIDDFQYFESNSTIKITVSNMTTDQTHGFCRLTIPHNLLSPPYNVIINDNIAPYIPIFDNETLSIIYFSYEHSTLEIIIIPEFPTWTSMLLILIVLTVAIAIYKRRLLKKPIH